MNKKEMKKTRINTRNIKHLTTVRLFKTLTDELEMQEKE